MTSARGPASRCGWRRSRWTAPDERSAGAAQEIVEPLHELAAGEHLVHAGPVGRLHEIGLQVAEEAHHARGPRALRGRHLLDDARLPEVEDEDARPELPGRLLERGAARGDLHVGPEPLCGGQDLGAEDEVADGQDDGHARAYPPGPRRATSRRWISRSRRAPRGAPSRSGAEGTGIASTRRTGSSSRPASRSEFETWTQARWRDIPSTRIGYS